MCLTCYHFLPISMSHLVVCSFINTPLYGFDPLCYFFHFRLYMRRSKYTQLCIYTGCPLPSCVYTTFFFEQSCTSFILVYFLMWEVTGRVVSVVGYS